MAKNTKSTENTAVAEITAEEAEILQAMVEAAATDAEADADAATDEEVITVLAAANEDEASDQASDPTAAADEDETAEATASLQDLIASVTASEMQFMHAALASAFDDRAQYERDADASNTNIQKTLSKAKAAHLTPNITKAFVAAEIDPNYVNASEVTGKRRNVYALEKLRDFLYAAVTGHLKNAINIACMTSLVKLKDTTALPFTGAVAKACASDKCAVANDYKSHLVRHTVAESTASTQASSTMTALEVLGVVKNTGTRPHPVYVLTNTPLSRRLQEVVNPAIAA